MSETTLAPRSKMSRPASTFTINTGAACDRIDWAIGLLTRIKLPLSANLEHVDKPQRALAVPDGLLLLITDSATAIRQPSL